MTLIILSILLASSTASLVFSIKRNLMYMETIDDIEEKLKLSIDILEKEYFNIEKKTKIEVFSDEPIIKELLDDMTNAKNSVLIVAKLLDDSIEIEDLKKVKEDEMT